MKSESLKVEAENGEIDAMYVVDSLKVMLADYFVGEITKHENSVNLLLLSGKQFKVTVEEVK